MDQKTQASSSFALSPSSQTKILFTWVNPLSQALGLDSNAQHGLGHNSLQHSFGTSTSAQHSDWRNTQPQGSLFLGCGSQPDASDNAIQGAQQDAWDNALPQNSSWAGITAPQHAWESDSHPGHGVDTNAQQGQWNAQQQGFPWADGNAQRSAWENTQQQGPGVGTTAWQGTLYNTSQQDSAWQGTLYNKPQQEPGVETIEQQNNLPEWPPATTLWEGNWSAIPGDSWWSGAQQGAWDNNRQQGSNWAVGNPQHNNGEITQPEAPLPSEARPEADPDPELQKSYSYRRQDRAIKETSWEREQRRRVSRANRAVVVPTSTVPQWLKNA